MMCKFLNPTYISDITKIHYCNEEPHCRNHKVDSILGILNSQ